jgi:hypothetical protein
LFIPIVVIAELSIPIAAIDSPPIAHRHGLDPLTEFTINPDTIWFAIVLPSAPIPTVRACSRRCSGFAEDLL